jgi:hypothetical protein
MKWLFQTAATRAPLALAAAVAACESLWQTTASASTDKPMTEGQSLPACLDQNEPRSKTAALHGNAVESPDEPSGESPGESDELMTTETLEPAHLAATSSSCVLGVDHGLPAEPAASLASQELDTMEPCNGQGDHPAPAGPAVDPLATAAVEKEANANSRPPELLSSSHDTASVGGTQLDSKPMDHALNNWEPLPQELEAFK